MRSTLLLVLVLVFIGAAAWFLLSDDAAVNDFDGDELEAEDDGDEREGALLEGDIETANRNAARRAAERAQAEADALARADANARATPQVVIEGRVESAADGAPIKATVWIEPASDPCPRMPASNGIADIMIPEHSRLMTAGVTCDKDGRFRFEVPGDIKLADLRGRFDLFVDHPDFVGQARCALPNDQPLVIRLARGHALKGIVRDALQRPVADVTITTRPAQGTPNDLSHRATAVTGTDGRYELSGLAAGAIQLWIEDRRYMPMLVGPIDPKHTQTHDVQLISALLITLELETLGNLPPTNPRYSWKTSGTPEQTGLAMLAPHPAEVTPTSAVNTLNGKWTKNADGRYPARTFRVPCKHKEFTLSVQAAGHETWTSGPLLLPPEGGERTIRVPMLADNSKGSALVRFEKDGEVVPYSSLRAHAGKITTDQDVRTGLVLQASDTFRLSGMPPGQYAVPIAMPDHAPVVVRFTAVAGEEVEQTITLEPPATLRIRFLASEALTVRFRILKDSKLAPAFLAEERDDASTPETGETPQAAAGDEGTLFSGLGSGDHIIEVNDPTLKPSRTRITLTTGEEANVDINVEKR